MKIAAFIRVSTEKQKKKGESLTTQRTQIRNAAELVKGTITHWYGGGAESGKTDRTEFERLMADAYFADVSQMERHDVVSLPWA